MVVASSARDLSASEDANEGAASGAEAETAQHATDMTDSKPGEWHKPAAEGRDAVVVTSDSAPKNSPRSDPQASEPGHDLEVVNATRNDVPSRQLALDEGGMAEGAADGATDAGQEVKVSS